MREFSRFFRAMNTDVLTVVVAEPSRAREVAASLAAVEDLFAANEAELSRFQPESGLSRLNHAAGSPVRVSRLLFTVIEAALAAARATGGLFDPTVLNALIAAGYSRSFELLEDQPGGAGSLPPVGPVSWREVRVGPETRTITLPAGTGLDLGGIGKGWTVDRAAELLGAYSSYAVDAGGDLRVKGVQADGTPWTVGIEDPRSPEVDLLGLEVRDRAVATSTTRHRRWRQGTRERHHLIDPRTGQPAASDVLAATVIAGSAGRAEVLAKVALILGARDGTSWLDRQPDAAGVLVLANGKMVPSARFWEVAHAA